MSVALIKDFRDVSWAARFGGGEWMDVSGGRRVGDDVDIVSQIALSKAIPEALRGLHDAVVNGRDAPDVSELVDAAASVLPMAAEVVRLAASDSDNSRMFLDAKTVDSDGVSVPDDDENVGEFMGSIAPVSAFFSLSAQDGADVDAKPGFIIMALGQIMANSVAVEAVSSDGTRIKKSLANQDDFEWLVENAGYNPFVSAYEITARASGAVVMDGNDSLRCHVMGSFMPLPLTRERWVEEGFEGEFNPRLMTINVSHRTGGHLSVVLAFRWSGKRTDPIEARMVAARHESVEEHRDVTAASFVYDPFASRAAEHSNRRYQAATPEEVEHADDGESDLQQAGRMLKALGELLEAQGKERSGWQEFDENGEVRDVRSGTDPFEGLILSGGRKAAKA